MGEGSSIEGNVTDTLYALGGVLTSVCTEGMYAGPVKPSLSREERSRSKVGTGNGVEDRRVAAEFVVAENHR